MRSIKKRLELMGQPEEKPEAVSEGEREQVLALTTQLAEPELSLEARLVIVAQLRLVMLGEQVALNAPLIRERRQLDDHPPPSLNVLGHP